ACNGNKSNKKTLLSQSETRMPTDTTRQSDMRAGETCMPPGQMAVRSSPARIVAQSMHPPVCQAVQWRARHLFTTISSARVQSISAHPQSSQIINFLLGRAARESNCPLVSLNL